MLLDHRGLVMAAVALALAVAAASCKSRGAEPGAGAGAGAGAEPGAGPGAGGPGGGRAGPGAESGAEPAKPSPEPFACAADADCVASCSHGAVSLAWYRQHYPGGEGCKDGCTRKGTESPRCVDGGCVGRFQGADDPLCTRKEAEVMPGPGPAHRCQKDADCVNTCSLGAVNAAWLANRSDFADCRDGCTHVGMNDPKCEEGLCVAYEMGARMDGCTQMPVF